MKINFTRLIQEFNKKHPKKKLTNSKFARVLVKEEHFTSEVSALNMMRISNAGQAKTINKSLIIFLCEFFGKKGSELIEWDDEITISDVAPHIRDDAPGLKKVK